MVIQHTIEAMFSNRNLKITNDNKKKSSEKLSSGYKINRAGDDAAGLSISEKMRRDIRGLRQGSGNIQDGISLIKTGEGALNEVHDMLQRMDELTIKGLNGTLTHEDREYVQSEIDNLYEEIIRVADSTTFNEMYVLKGDPLVHHEASTEITVATVDVIKKADSMPADCVTFSSQMTLGGASATTQNTNDGTSYKTVTDENGNLVNVQNSTWSETLSDNYGTTMDFSGLASKSGYDSTTGTNDFYEALSNFVGTGFYSTCCTCDEQYNIVFTDDNGTYVFKPDNAQTGVNTYNESYGGKTYVNLNNLLKKAETATSAEVPALTKEFLKLIEQTATSDSKMQKHYSRVKTDDSNPYKLYVYDFRDYVTDIDDDRYGYITSPPASTNELGKLGNIKGFLYIYGTKTEVVGTEYDSYEPLNIQHSSTVEDDSQIHLPDLASIFQRAQLSHGYDTVKQSLTLEELIPAQTVSAPGTWTTDTVTIPEHTMQVSNYTKPQPAIIYENGEAKAQKPVFTGYTTTTIPARTITVSHYNPGASSVIPEHYGDLNFPMIDVVKSLINYVSGMRSDFGAKQNVLEHSYNNNLNKEENTQASESLIRDTDMAAEMIRLSTHNILEQAGNAMLTQSNQTKQGVLSLLQ